MNELAGRDLVPVLARQADLFRDDGDLLDELAATLDPTDAKALAGGTAAAGPASGAPMADDRPSARRGHRRAGAAAWPAAQASGCDLGGGRRVERSRQRLRLLGEPTATPSR